MSRVVEALKALEVRRHVVPPAESRGGPHAWPAAPAPFVPRIAIIEPDGVIGAQVVEECTPTESESAAANAPVRCVLPFSTCGVEQYVPLAERIDRDLAPGGSRVLLFVAPDRAAADHFSLVDLAGAMVGSAASDALVVDGDLRVGRLSKAAGVLGAGMIEVMSGSASWAEVIQTTTTPQLDFIGCGNGQIPTFERPSFDFDAVRSDYQVILIGLGDAGEPETAWLAGRCDATYFVISRAHTRRQTAGEALGQLRAAGANVLGCVVVGD